jgi:hypothetical protein
VMCVAESKSFDAVQHCCEQWEVDKVLPCRRPFVLQRAALHVHIGLVW